MNLSRIDLNLLVYLDTLLREKNVTRAAEQLGITQPALSNGLRRLRGLFKDPLLVRTSEGMTPTERALELQPQVREILAAVEQAVLPVTEFNAGDSQRVFRIMASDYAEATLLAPLLSSLRELAPDICLDVLTPSDVSFQDLEQGKVDMAINRFDRLPQTFYQASLWHDGFSCLFSRDNPMADDFSLETYLSASHIWVSKTGVGAGRGMSRRVFISGTRVCAYASRPSWSFPSNCRWPGVRYCSMMWDISGCDACSCRRPGKSRVADRFFSDRTRSAELNAVARYNGFR